jgi:hypothetical protein
MAGGGCHCGGVRFETEGPPVRVGLCHCSDCRRSAGAPVVAWAIWPLEAVRVTRGAATTYASSEHGRRGFCPACGTGLFYTNDILFEGLIDVQLATLDDPGQFEPTEQIQVAERIPWMAAAHALPAHQRFPPDLG